MSWRAAATIGFAQSGVCERSSGPTMRPAFLSNGVLRDGMTSPPDAGRYALDVQLGASQPHIPDMDFDPIPRCLKKQAWDRVAPQRGLEGKIQTLANDTLQQRATFSPGRSIGFGGRQIRPYGHQLASDFVRVVVVGSGFTEGRAADAALAAAVDAGQNVDARPIGQSAPPSCRLDRSPAERLRGGMEGRFHPLPGCRRLHSVEQVIELGAQRLEGLGASAAQRFELLKGKEHGLRGVVPGDRDGAGYGDAVEQLAEGVLRLSGGDLGDLDQLAQTVAEGVSCHQSSGTRRAGTANLSILDAGRCRAETVIS
jgi:hypothetical protein